MGIWKNGCLVAVLIGLTATVSCTGTNEKDTMVGIYVNSAGGKYSLADDTLVVEYLGGRNYVVHRSTGFNLLTDGKLGVRQYETEEWKAVLEDGDGTVLLEQRWGKRLLFRQDPRVLEVGRRVYVKLD